MVLDDPFEFGDEFLRALLYRIELAFLAFDAVREEFIEFLEGDLRIAVLIELVEDGYDFVLLHARGDHSNELDELLQVKCALFILVEVLEDLLQG